jgi:pSer/pThr/pTyr-binding forkhead associated (FHA) protein
LEDRCHTVSIKYVSAKEHGMQASLNSPNGRTTLTANALTIGRSADNQLVLQDPQVSSHHAEIRPDAQGYVLTDLGSTNGSFVNEQRLPPRTPRLLISGDVIRIGTTSLSYEIAGSYDATVGASTDEYANPGYSPTVAAPQTPYSSYNPESQPGYPGYTDYQQQPPSSPNYSAQPGYPGYQQQPPSSPNYPAQPGYAGYQQPPQPGYAGTPPGYPPQQPSWAAAAPVPGQYGVPGYPAPAAPVPPKRRTGLIIGIVILLLVVVGAGIGGYIYLNRSTSTPEKTLQAYCTALQTSDAQGVFNQLSAHAQGQTSVQRISLGFQILDAPQVGGVKGCTFSNVQQNGSTAKATVVITAGVSGPSNPPITDTFTLVNENGTWKIDMGRVPGQ